jgi:hypothetical protein
VQFLSDCYERNSTAVTYLTHTIAGCSMKFTFLKLLLSYAFLVPFCLSSFAGESRISGVYVGHGTNFAEMLQLTQTANGQISGVFTSVELDSAGAISSSQTNVSGTINEGQISLKLGSFLFARTLAGAISGKTIRLQMVDSKGNISSPLFVLSGPDEFSRYADNLKRKGEATVLTVKLLKSAQEFRHTVQNAESWITSAELHATKIPRIRSSYDKIEGEMRSLVAREKQTVDSVTRTQISLQVGQGDLAGDQTDLQVEQVWDVTIISNGASLNKSFVSWDGKCGDALNFQRHGATTQAIETWETACESALKEREKFTAIFNNIIKQRAEVKSIQEMSQSRRKALVQEATRLE